MDAAILNVGTELLMGEIVNTNAAYLSEQMKKFGINVYYQIVVGDNHKRLQSVLGILSEKVDVIIMTGGLGPTKDDMTKEAVSSVFKRELKQNPEAVKQMENIMKRYGRSIDQITENNYRQTFFPEGSRILKNDMGSAPGFILETDEGKKAVICLPGPPFEMKAMFNAHLNDYFSKKSDVCIHSRVLRLSGIGESKVETELMDLIESQEDPTIATYAKPGDVAIRVATKQRNRESAEKALEPTIREIKRRLGQYIYSEEDREWNEMVIDLLKEKNWKISTVESCTGGLLASNFVDVPGASDVFEEGFITYNNSSKEKRVRVGKKILNEFGAVSIQTAEAMARGLYEEGKSDVCISVTGVAGPEGGTDEKPVGLVHAAFLVNGKLEIETYNVRGDRQRIRAYTVRNIMKKLYQILKKVD
ncbi:MAG: competence/damage-inducible protein A [Peptostreptococcaceae bacterium]|nr:competence/damage-inducible protein A [Peptostreptococcaceae bacterium]